MVARKLENFMLGLNIAKTMFFIILFVVGAVLRAYPGLVESYIRSNLGTQLAKATRAGLLEMRTDDIDVVDILEHLSYVIIGVSVVMLVTSAAGLVLARHHVKPLLVAYIVVLCILCITHVAVTYLLYADRSLLDSIVKPILTIDLQTNYAGLNATDPVSQMWNVAMVTLKCCGVNGYTDFADAHAWSRNYDQDGFRFELTTPRTCCVLENKEPRDFSCAVNPTDASSYYKTGCVSKAWAVVDMYRLLPIFILILGTCLQVVLVLTSCVLLRSSRGQKTDRPTNIPPSVGTHGPLYTGDYAGETFGGVGLLAQNLFGMSRLYDSDMFKDYFSSAARRNTAANILSHLMTGPRDTRSTMFYNGPRSSADHAGLPALGVSGAMLPKLPSCELRDSRNNRPLNSRNFIDEIDCDKNDDVMHLPAIEK